MRKAGDLRAEPAAITSRLPQAEPERRPRTRAECFDGPRPCPWYGCRHHLGIEVGAGGELHVRELEELAATCALDLVDANPDGMPLDAIATAIGLVSVEGVRAVEAKALSKVPGRAPGLRDHAVDEGRDPARRGVVVQEGAHVPDDEGEPSDVAVTEEDVRGAFLDSDAAACAMVHRVLAKRENDRRMAAGSGADASRAAEERAGALGMPLPAEAEEPKAPLERVAERIAEPVPEELAVAPSRKQSDDAEREP